MNNNIMEQIFLGNDAILDVDLIERLEFIRGPGYPIYSPPGRFA